jgi:hypothetical protein
MKERMRPETDLHSALAPLSKYLSSTSEVVICPLSLPDADWPERLKHLSANAKIAFMHLVNGRSIKLCTFTQSAIQKIGVGESVLINLLDLKPPSTPAAFSSHGVTPPYISIRPISLHAGRDHVVLKQSDGSYATGQQLMELALAAKPVFERFGLALHTPYQSINSEQTRNARWFLTPISEQAQCFFDLATSDSQQALGRNIDAYMASGDSARQWRQLETEIQMTWYDHPVNHQLRQQRDDELNSIWIDGSITANPVKPAWLNSLTSSRSALVELADFWGIAPPAPNVSIDHTGKHSGNMRIVDLWQCRLYGDALTWLQSWETFLTDKSNGDPSKLLMFAGETSLLIIYPAETSISAKLKSLLALAPSAARQKRVLLAETLGL